jgi:GTP-binding protein Era
MTHAPRTSETIPCGFIAIIGRPNVGKSTLMNRILGQKISITSRKPQTTRHRIVGIKTTAAAQMIFVDTPGLHHGGKRTMNRLMNRAALDALNDVDVILFVTEAGLWTTEDQSILERLRKIGQPIILVINKVDQVNDKGTLLPQIESLAEGADFVDVLPLSARRGDNVDGLELAIQRQLPVSIPLYPPDQVTDRSERFIAAELIREKLMRRLGQELPYSLAVEIEQFVEEGQLLRISALVWVERDSQKAIVIGKNGAGLKAIGKQARIDMENIFGCKVFLQLWVKVKDKWTDDDRMLKGLGYSD